MASANELPQPMWCLIDANLNRAGEGLRVLEDVARLVLHDAELSPELETMRRELAGGDLRLNRRLIETHPPESDRNAGAPAPQPIDELPELVMSNALAVRESLRVIEEVARLKGAGPELEPDRFSRMRTRLYAIEQALLSRLLRRDKAEKISGLHAIIDTEALGGKDHATVTREIIHGGAKAIQLRDKFTGKKELIRIARQLKALCAEHGVLFIINDYLDIALATDADGLHLGQEDLPIEVARRLLPIDRILGCSTHSPEQAKAAAADGADYVAIGSIYPTPTKETAFIAGLDGLRGVREAASLPVVAIGGITADNVAEVMAAGADSIAVISAILRSDSPEAAARQIVSRIEASHEQTD
jgi:thiamine-phosphate pyrophosphorylase